MRIENSIKNISIAMTTQITMALLGFISRKVFIDSLGVEYLGLNGVMTNVISILGLVESGIGASIVFSLYKPLAENDKPKIITLVQLYKKIYFVIAFIILGLSLLIYPYMSVLLKGNTTSKFITTIVFFIFISKNMISYLFAYKWSLINADQKGYILGKRNLIFNVILISIKILILKITKNYILFLVVELICILLQSIINGKIVDKLYPYIKTKEKYNLDIDTKTTIINKVKAVFLHNVGGQIVFGTDNILISSFINISTVGIYSNYTMIMNQLESIIKPIIGGMGASIGNLIATESEEKTYSVFKITYFISFWIYSLCTIFLYNLLQPFIIWLFSEKFLLNEYTFFVIIINFYITGMRSSITTFKGKAGAFEQDKYAPIIEGGINLVASITLVKYLGLVGIFIGTTISTILVPLWNQPRIVYKYVFKKPLLSYFKEYIKYVVITILVGYITTLVCSSVCTGYSFLSLVVRGLICVTIPNILFIIIFNKSDEFKYLLNVVKPKITKMNKLLVRN